MKTALLIAAVASMSLLAACNRTDNSVAGTNPAVADPGTTADVRSSSVPPITESTSPTKAPALPSPQYLPSGAGEAAPAAAAAAAANGSAPPSASGATTTAQDTGANRPMDEMTPHEESTQMPKAGQANNYSSPALEQSPGQSPGRAQ
jgi:hypothetical protein